MSKELVVTQEVKDALEIVRVAGGGLLTPEAVVTAAQVEGTPLHVAFAHYDAWDAEKAQKNWQLALARTLIMRVKVTVLDKNNEPQTIRAYVSLTADRREGLGYRSATEVMAANPGAMLRTAQKELASFRKKYANLEELTSVIEAIDALDDANTTESE